jgi:hypothetical protein
MGRSLLAGSRKISDATLIFRLVAIESVLIVYAVRGQEPLVDPAINAFLRDIKEVCGFFYA